MEIHSYRTVFELERRIYRLEQLRLNPTGLPVRGLVYGVGLLVGGLVLTRLPMLGGVLELLPWYLRDLAAPLVGATLLYTVRVDGRPFHLTVVSMVRYVLGPRRLAGLRRCESPGARWRPPEILMYPDGSDGRLRSLRCTGPGVVLVAPAHERVEWEVGLRRRSRRAEVRLTELVGERAPAAPEPVILAAGSRMRVR